MQFYTPPLFLIPWIFFLPWDGAKNPPSFFGIVIRDVGTGSKSEFIFVNPSLPLLNPCKLEYLSFLDIFRLLKETTRLGLEVILRSRVSESPFFYELSYSDQRRRFRFHAPSPSVTCAYSSHALRKIGGSQQDSSPSALLGSLEKREIA